MVKLEEALRRDYFASRATGTTEDEKLLRDQLIVRLDTARYWFVPWLDSIRPLVGLRILEIGCGTGSSTVALSEQGARVTGIDIHEPSIEIARLRLSAYGLPDDLHLLNVTEFPSRLGSRPFDLILFYASLEHMLHEERIDAMRTTWAALAPGSMWGIVDTPNRLWFQDLHTSWLPFFQWLPDDLAQQYAHFSSRPLLRSVSRDKTAEAREDFLRKGRGVSYHEFDLAMKPVADLRVLGCMKLSYRRSRPLPALKRALTISGSYERFLRKAAPDVPPAFLLPSLDLVIEKD